jgi:hypothetical protein
VQVLEDDDRGSASPELTQESGCYLVRAGSAPYELLYLAAGHLGDVE